jgi:ribonuclease R
MNAISSITTSRWHFLPQPKKRLKDSGGNTGQRDRCQEGFPRYHHLTIDPEDAKDFDDALSLRKLDNGNWEVGVHIADVSWYVKPERHRYRSLQRGTSIYLVDRTIPMLPEKLSNHLCSLRPHEEKRCFSAVFELDEDATVKAEWFGKTIIRSDRRFHYEEVQRILEGGEGDLKEELLTLHALSSKLRNDRLRKGSINFKSQEVKFGLMPGQTAGSLIKEQKRAKYLIEDFMLLQQKGS